MSGAAKKKRPRLQEKLEDKDCKVPGGQKSALNSRSKNPLGHTFVNILAINFDLCPADGIKMAIMSSGPLLCYSTLVGSV
jgi:hypothetical protein